MAIVKWDPFDMRSLWRWPEEWEESVEGGGGLDVYETKSEVVIKANVAGVPADKVDVTFEKGLLWIRAEAEEEREEDKADRKYYRKSARAYSYKVAVPGNVDMAVEPEAVVKDGVVELKFKKAEEAQPKKITVRSH